MKTIIYLEGDQGTGKSTFLAKNKIPEIDVYDLTQIKLSPFKDYENIMGITNNSPGMFGQISKVIPYDFLVLRLKVPNQDPIDQMGFYGMLTELIRKIRD